MQSTLQPTMPGGRWTCFIMWPPCHYSTPVATTMSSTRLFRSRHGGDNHFLAVYLLFKIFFWPNFHIWKLTLTGLTRKLFSSSEEWSERVSEGTKVTQTLLFLTLKGRKNGLNMNNAGRRDVLGCTMYIPNQQENWLHLRDFLRAKPSGNLKVWGDVHCATHSPVIIW